MSDSEPIIVKAGDVVTFRDNERKLFAQYVTAERQKWRERIRELALETVNIAAQTGNLSSSDVHKLMVIRAELKVRLNLKDKNDIRLILHLAGIIKQKFHYDRRLVYIRCFEDEVSWLLKEDWERVKHDSLPLWFWWRSKVDVDRKKRTSSKKKYTPLHNLAGLILSE